MRGGVGKIAVIIAAGLVLSACNTTGLVERGASVTDDPLAPPGTATRGAAARGGVDPLIVGDRLMAAGEPELALDSYLRAAADGGLTPEIRVAMASANIRLGRLHQARRLLRSALEEEPENPRTMNDLGVVLMELGELGEAHRLFRAAFALQPTPEIRENLRVSSAKLENRAYDEPEEDAFMLTARGNGLYRLTPPGQR